MKRVVLDSSEDEAPCGVLDSSSSDEEEDEPMPASSSTRRLACTAPNAWA
jgi:hypothetical protein